MLRQTKLMSIAKSISAKPSRLPATKESNQPWLREKRILWRCAAPPCRASSAAKRFGVTRSSTSNAAIPLRRPRDKKTAVARRPNAGKSANKKSERRRLTRPYSSPLSAATLANRPSMKAIRAIMTLIARSAKLSLFSCKWASLLSTFYERFRFPYPLATNSANSPLAIAAVSSL